MSFVKFQNDLGAEAMPDEKGLFDPQFVADGFAILDQGLDGDVFGVDGWVGTPVSPIIPGNDLKVVLKGILEIFPKKGGNPHSIAKNYGKTQADCLIINRRSISAVGKTLLEAQELG
jgi:hypothetical protein